MSVNQEFMRIFIRKLNSRAAIQTVMEEFKKTGLICRCIEYGVIELVRIPPPDQWKEIENNLLKQGLKISQEENSFVSIIRRAVNEVVEKRNNNGNNLLFHLSEKLGISADFMNKFFFEETGYTIAELFLENSIEKRKRKRSMIEKYRNLFKMISD